MFDNFLFIFSQLLHFGRNFRQCQHGAIFQHLGVHHILLLSNRCSLSIGLSDRLCEFEGFKRKRKNRNLRSQTVKCDEERAFEDPVNSILDATIPSKGEVHSLQLVYSWHKLDIYSKFMILCVIFTIWNWILSTDCESSLHIRYHPCAIHNQSRS